MKLVVQMMELQKNKGSNRPIFKTKGRRPPASLYFTPVDKT